MYTLMQKAVGYFYTSEDGGQIPPFNIERPKLEDFISETGWEREEFEGVVTMVREREVVVNSDIYFSIPFEEPKSKFKVGDAVRGMAERKSEYEAWRALRMTLHPTEEGWDAAFPKLRGQAIQCRDLEAGIPGILKKDLFTMTGSIPSQSAASEALLKQGSEAKKELPKTVIGKVKEILADSFSLDGHTYLKLSTAASSFDLWQGDWVVCKLKDLQKGEIHPKGPVEVSCIDPLRRKKIQGKVTFVQQMHFVINGEVYCSRASAKELQIHLGLTVTAEIIESSQQQFCWRAICVSHGAASVLQDISMDPPYKHRKCEGHTISSLLENKHGIIISDNLRFPQVLLGLRSQITVFIKNTGDQACLLSRIYFATASHESQFSVVFGLPDGTAKRNPVKIMPSDSFHIEMACDGKILGNIRELCIFDFGDFQIGRYVAAAIEDKSMVFLAPSIPYRPRERQKPCRTQPQDSRIVKGEKPFRAPAFLPVSLPSYFVPEELLEAMDCGENLLDIAPYLADSISVENYQDRFSLLLHLEEIEMTRQMRQFDMPRALFSRHGEFLSLKVPGLAENRPSLLIGDTVIASNPGSEVGTEYEGYIHEVLHTQILLKFHPSFHEQYGGEDYAVRFNFNRTPLRRCHFALKFTGEQLGASVLFPTKLKLQLPQTCYVDREAMTYSSKRKANADIHQREGHHRTEKSCSVKDSFGKDISSSAISKKYVNGYKGKIDLENQEVSVRTSHLSKLGKYNGDVVIVDTGSIAQPDCSIQKGTGTSKMISSVERINNNLTLGPLETNGEKLDNLSSSAQNVKPKAVLGLRETDLREITVHQGGILDESRLKGKNNGECSPIITKNAFKKSSSVTPPRIPVVTRLFGVPSSGSSNNSSMCCSDDESRNNLEFESDNRFSVTQIEKKIQLNSDRPVNSSSKDGDLKGKNLSDRYMNSSRKTSNCNGSSTNGINVGLKNKCLKESPNTKQLGESNEGNLIQNNGIIENGSLNGNNICEIKEKVTSENNGLFRSLKVSADKAENYCIPVLPVVLNKKLKKKKDIPFLKWFNKDLNSEQKTAVRRVLEGSTRPMPYVIYGPPGTGKTITVVESILQIFSLVHHSRLLIVTPSNSAADLITDRLIKFDLLTKADFVRLNAYQRKEESVPESIRPYCCNGDDLKERVHQRVIVTTAGTSGLLYTLGLHNGHFTHVLVDEAGQLTEPECLVALGLVNSVSGQIVLAGDPQQLGPTIQSRWAKNFGLQESLLHRLCNSILYQPEEGSGSSAWMYEPQLVTQLVKNYRSHPDVIHVPSKLFYHSSLQAHANSQVMEKLLKWDELPNPLCPLLFHGLVSENHQEGDSPSWFNPAEAFQVVRYVKSLITFGVEHSSIGIITPYRKQVQKIRQVLAMFAINGDIKVGSVEEFQGQERPVIIISTVRSSEQLLEVDARHSLGFVKCHRRFNVAITRAQSLLVVVGNPHLLVLDRCWFSFIHFCIGKKAYRGPELHLEDESRSD